MMFQESVCNTDMNTDLGIDGSLSEAVTSFPPTTIFGFCLADSPGSSRDSAILISAFEVLWPIIPVEFTYVIQ
jgi:hypothetical protein